MSDLSVSPSAAPNIPEDSYTEKEKQAEIQQTLVTKSNDEKSSEPEVVKITSAPNSESIPTTADEPLNDMLKLAKEYIIRREIAEQRAEFDSQSSLTSIRQLSQTDSTLGKQSGLAKQDPLDELSGLNIELFNQIESAKVTVVEEKFTKPPELPTQLQKTQAEEVAEDEFTVIREQNLNELINLQRDFVKSAKIEANEKLKSENIITKEENFLKNDEQELFEDAEINQNVAEKKQVLANKPPLSSEEQMKAKLETMSLLKAFTRHEDLVDKFI